MNNMRLWAIFLYFLTMSSIVPIQAQNVPGSSIVSRTFLSSGGSDKMHGLDTCDYGARQYTPDTARWDRVDPLCEKYYEVSPYVYCHNNPVMLVDPDGKADYFTTSGKFVKSDNNKKDPFIYIQTKNGNIQLSNYNFGNGHNNLMSMMRVVYTR